jgi:hypothetical protein
MNPKHSEQIFDALLEEMLTEKHPPDLTARIVNAWRTERALESNAQAPNSKRSASVKAELVQSAESTAVLQKTSTQQKISQKTGEGQSIRQAPALSPSVVTARKKPETSHDRTRIAWILATVAATLLVLLGWRANEIYKDAQVAAITEPDVQPQVEPERLQTATMNQPPKVHETLPLDDLPFSGSDSTIAQVPTVEQPNIAEFEKLESQDVVAELDRRLEAMWSSLGVTPSPAYDAATLAQKTSRVLTGQDPSLSDSNNSDRQAIVAEALDSRVFAKHWADKFIAQWLGPQGRSRQGGESNALALAELNQVIAARIENGGKWNEVILDLLGGSFDNAKSSNTAFAAALAGGENHHLIEQLGTGFLDANMACIRCHDVGSRPTLNTESQETYWSLVAMLRGLDSQVVDGEGRKAMDRQAELFASRNDSKVFFDLPNGALKSAEAKLPDGSNWSADGASPRQALAEWISQSPQTDQATVNLVWKLVFGRPLVPYVTQADSVAVASRTELLDLLTAQFRAHDHDLKSLVGWVVSSAAFARQPLSLDKSQWLAASDEELQVLQLRELVFAAGPSRSGDVQSLENSLLAVVEWKRPGDANATLAQPATATNNGKPKLPSSVTMPAMSFILHGQQPTISQQNFVKSLLKAERLSWEQRVEHVVGLRGCYSTSDRVQQLARQLLEENSGDASSALLQLLWAVQNSNAS